MPARGHWSAVGRSAAVSDPPQGDEPSTSLTTGVGHEVDEPDRPACMTMSHGFTCALTNRLIMRAAIPAERAPRCRSRG